MPSSNALHFPAVKRKVALTGTPGTGKSTVARLISDRWKTLEVMEIARRMGSRPNRAGALTIDLAKLRRQSSHRPEFQEAEVLVGHLAHFLPLRDVIVLRCHPLELGRRLGRENRGSAEDRAANVVVEATDLILLEAIRLRRRIWEIDTSHRSPTSIAKEVERRLRDRGPAEFGKIDWLADRSVTESL